MLRGWRWVTRSIEIFGRAAMVWIGLNLVLLFIASALMMIPVVGGLLFALLTPVFAGGLTLGCRDLDAGHPLLPKHLFAGFQANAGALVTIGGVYVVGQIAIFGLLTVIGGPELQSIMHAAVVSQEPDNAPATVSDRALAAVIVAGALLVPLAMSVWFAPVLAVLHRLPALQALRFSLQASLRNLPAMTVYAFAMGALLAGLLFIARTLIGLLPTSLSAMGEPIAMIAMTLWVSLTLISAYTGYRDIFVTEDPATPY